MDEDNLFELAVETKKKAEYLRASIFQLRDTRSCMIQIQSLIHSEINREWRRKKD